MRFIKTKWVVIGVVCCILVIITAGPFIGRFILQMHTYAKEQCRYISDINMLGHQLEGYLQRYYKEHGRYPDRLNIAQFKVWEEPKYRTILDNIKYSTDGNSFEIIWEYPIRFGDNGDTFVWTCKGQGGKRTHFETETVRHNGSTLFKK